MKNEKQENSIAALRREYPWMTKADALDVMRGAARVSRRLLKKFGPFLQHMAERAAAYPIEVLKRELRGSGLTPKYTEDIRLGDPVYLDAHRRRVTPLPEGDKRKPCRDAYPYELLCPPPVHGDPGLLIPGNPLKVHEMSHPVTGNKVPVYPVELLVGHAFGLKSPTRFTTEFRAGDLLYLKDGRVVTPLWEGDKRKPCRFPKKKSGKTS